MILADKKLWVIGEGLAGTENQCLGICDALGVKPIIKRIQLREPWKRFSPTLGFEQWWSFDPLLHPPWPDIVIAAGRKAIAPARFIRKQSNQKSFTIFLQDPRCDLDDFDLIAAPAHDELAGANVVTTAASPNRITSQKLKTAKKQYPEFETLPAPRLAVLIGGNSKTHKITKDIAESLVQDLQKLGMGLMISISRRTPEKITEYLKSELSKDPACHFYDGTGSNPYFAYLAYADAILVTNDSASMLSDAATTGKPVYSIALEGSSAKFEKLYDSLKKQGALRPFEGKIEHWEYEPLNDARKIATSITKALEKREKTKNE